MFFIIIVFSREQGFVSNIVYNIYDNDLKFDFLRPNKVSKNLFQMKILTII